MKAFSLKNKKTNLFITLSAIFLTNAIVAEIIGVKIFSVEAMVGVAPAQIKLLKDFVLDFNLTAGAIIWPIVFITTDIINEYFGKEGVRKISILTSIIIAYVFLVLWTASSLPPSGYWLEVNQKDIAGHPFNINSAYATIFRQGLGIIIGSITAFLIGQLLDVYVFHAIRKFTGSKKIWLRATGSTLVSQLVDSFVVLFIAFYVFGGTARWSISFLLSVGIINYIYKFSVALILTPLLYVAHHYIDSYLGEEIAEEMIDAADNSY